jgi:hypothetical protein
MIVWHDYCDNHVRYNGTQKLPQFNGRSTSNQRLRFVSCSTRAVFLIPRSSVFISYTSSVQFLLLFKFLVYFCALPCQPFNSESKSPYSTAYSHWVSKHFLWFQTWFGTLQGWIAFFPPVWWQMGKFHLNYGCRAFRARVRGSVWISYGAPIKRTFEEHHFYLARSQSAV